MFLVEVLCNGRRHTVAKRYSEFQALHKRVRTPGSTGPGGALGVCVPTGDLPGRHAAPGPVSMLCPALPQIKKTCKVPDFPPRRVPNWVPKVLEQRRQGLELYIQVRHQRAAAAPRILGVLMSPPSLPQGVLCRNKELPQDVLDFLKVRRCQQDPKGSSAP